MRRVGTIAMWGLNSRSGDYAGRFTFIPLSPSLQRGLPQPTISRHSSLRHGTATNLRPHEFVWDRMLKRLPMLTQQRSGL